MVWALRAVDAALAPSSYYLKSASTYSVGRKDCYITIQTDKTISRLHANLITEEAKALDADINDVAHIPRMSLRVHDFSKFGTFVNKKLGSKPVNSLPGSEVSLKDGDIVTFGTNKTSFRLEFIPFFLCISAPDGRKENPTSRFALRHGAYAAESWKEGCTHVLVDEGSVVTEMVIAAVAFNKPVIQINWWQKFSMETEVVTELLPYSSYLPTLVFEGAASFTPIKIALPELRKNILQDYSFFLVPVDMYEHGNYLIRLLEAAGATVELLSKTASNIPTGTRQQLVVKPRDGTTKESSAYPAMLNKIRHLPRTSEDKLVLAVLAGSVDDTSLPLPSSPISIADSDETVEASDENEDHDSAGTLSFRDFQAAPPKAGTATIPIDLDEDDSPIVEVKRTSKRSRPEETFIPEPYANTEPVDAKRQKVSTLEYIAETPVRTISQQDYTSILRSKGSSKPEPILEPLEQTGRGTKRPSTTIDKFFSQPAKKLHLTPEVSDVETAKGLPDHKDEPPYSGSSKNETRPKTEFFCKEAPRVVGDFSGAVEADVVYSQLVVRQDVGLVPSPTTPAQGLTPNFKRFRKKILGSEVSGNTYTTLIPFAKEPYRESDLSRQSNEFMQFERKRKEAERVAEDLFHNEKLKNATSKSRSRARK